MRMGAMHFGGLNLAVFSRFTLPPSENDKGKL
jgi:hypothetical protein